MEDVQSRCELFERQRRLAKTLSVARGTDFDSIAPVLAAVVIGIEEINPHLTFRVERGPENGNGVPADKPGGTIGHRNTRRLRVDQRLIAVVVGVIAGIEMPDKAFQIMQLASGHIHVNGKSAPGRPAVELRVHPFVGIALAADAQPAHLHINAVQMRHYNQGDRIQIEGYLGRDTADTAGRRHRLAFKVNDDLIVSGSPGHHLQEIIRIVIGPHRESTGRLAGRIVALPHAQRLAQHIQHALNQPGIGLRLVAIGQFKSLPRMGAQREPCLAPQTRRNRRLIKNTPLQQ